MGSDALSIVAFSAGGCRCAIESRYVDGMRRGCDAENPRVPRPLSADELLGFSAGQSSGCILRLRTEGKGVVDLVVGEPVEMLSIPREELQPLPDLVALRCSVKGLFALGIYAGELLLVIDPEK